MNNEASVSPINASLRIPELDGLRGLAIALVLSRHYFDNLLTAKKYSVAYVLLAAVRLSWSGVDLFFVLSGFLIGGILLDSRNSPKYFGTFYFRRACRILPAYFVVCVWAWAAPALWNWPQLPSVSWLFQPLLPWFSYFTYTQNFWMARRAIFGATGIGITWSLAVEEQFYMTLPVAIRYLKPRLLTFALIAGAIAAPVLRIALRLKFPHQYLAQYVLMPCRADALLLGVLCAVLVRKESGWKFVTSRRRILWWAFAALVPGLLWLIWGYQGPYSLRMISLGYTWLALFYAIFLLLGISNPESILSQALRLRPLRWLGSIAYGVYLWHLVFLGLCVGLIRGHYIWIRDFGDLGAVLLALGLTLGTCALSWKYFEKPFVRLGHRAKY
jgi:peptidoglycan/LPS O-acetylase OafA/YrhL